MSAIEAPNFFITSDFKSFKPVSDVQPQKEFNWLTTELLEWKGLDGTSLQGILYKPENFSATKKYPIIFTFYEKESHKLNYYLPPAPSEGEINIPYFVSNGYLVFTPDIHYKIGSVGQSAVNSVLAAAKYLSRFPWVDSNKMGIHGHSFRAYEVNYLITKTNIFAAAISACGQSDLISRYGSGSRGGYSIEWAETNQGRIGATLWDSLQLYIKNSPIFEANKIMTPLLLMNNKGDETVPYSQGIELFSGLRRLGKKVWLLQYNDGDHSISGKLAEDYTSRMMEFFDHYLRGNSIPGWMDRTSEK